MWFIVSIWRWKRRRAEKERELRENKWFGATTCTLHTYARAHSKQLSFINKNMHIHCDYTNNSFLWLTVKSWSRRERELEERIYRFSKDLWRTSVFAFTVDSTAKMKRTKQKKKRSWKKRRTGKTKAQTSVPTRCNCSVSLASFSSLSLFPPLT